MSLLVITDKLQLSGELPELAAGCVAEKISGFQVGEQSSLGMVARRGLTRTNHLLSFFTETLKLPENMTQT